MKFAGNEVFDLSIEAEVEYFNEVIVLAGDEVATYSCFFLYLVRDDVENKIKQSSGEFNPLFYLASICRKSYDFEIIPQGCERDFWKTPKSTYDRCVCDAEKSDEALIAFKEAYAKSITENIAKNMVSDKGLFNKVLDQFRRKNFDAKLIEFISDLGINLDEHSSVAKKRKAEKAGEPNDTDPSASAGEMSAEAGAATIIIDGKEREVGSEYGEVEIRAPSSSPLPSGEAIGVRGPSSSQTASMNDTISHFK